VNDQIISCVLSEYPLSSEYQRKREACWKKASEIVCGILSAAPFTNFAPQNQKTKAKQGLTDEGRVASTPEVRDGEYHKAFSYVKP